MTEELVLPPGEYYIGDPCYVIEPWDDWLDVWFDGPSDDRGGTFRFRNKTCAAFYTEYGDGSYEVTEGASGWLGVDSGAIGAIPMSIAGNAEGAGISVTFKKPAKCYANGGWLHFGDVVVNTSDDEEEDV